MKILFIAIMVATTLIFTCCKKDKEVVKEVDVKSLIIGKWKLVQYRQGNEPWKDSTGGLYNFINEDLVITTLFANPCERKYFLGNSSDASLYLKGVDFSQNFSFFFQDSRPFDIVTINAGTLEIFYPEYFGGGGLTKVYERYKKE